MDTGPIERGILIRINGDGSIVVSHDGLNPVECMGLLAMAQVYIMDDLHLREQKQVADAALLDVLKEAKVK
jgi:hypothetical protein